MKIKILVMGAEQWPPISQALLMSWPAQKTVQWSLPHLLERDIPSKSPIGEMELLRKPWWRGLLAKRIIRVRGKSPPTCLIFISRRGSRS